MGNKIINSLLIAGAVVAGVGITTASENNITEVQAAMGGAGGLTCDSSMNTKIYMIDVPATIDYSLSLSAAEKISLIRSKATLKEMINTCNQSSGMLDIDENILNSSLINIRLVDENTNTYTLSYENVSVNVVLTVDGKAPVISGYQATYYSSIAESTSLEKILSNIVAYDGYDGKVDTYIISDNYTGHENELGEYTVEVGAIDSSNNATSITITVKVVDDVKPIITGSSSFVSNLSSPLLESTIRASLKSTDNYDGIIEVVLKVDNYTGHENELGEHTIYYTTTDAAGNESESFMVTVFVVDDISPVITAENNEISVSYKGKLNADYVKSLLLANDNIDGNVSSSIKMVEDTYTSNSTIVGNRYMKFQATDAAGNIAEFTMDIKIEDIDAPVFYISDSFIGTEVILTHEQIVAVIAKMKGLDKQNYTYAINDEEYVANSETPGTYPVLVSYTLEDGSAPITYQVDIKVLGEDSVKDNSTQAEKDNTISAKVMKVAKSKLTWIVVGSLVGLLAIVKMFKKSNHKTKKRK